EPSLNRISVGPAVGRQVERVQAFGAGRVGRLDRADLLLSAALNLQAPDLGMCAPLAKINRPARPIPPQQVVDVLAQTGNRARRSAALDGEEEPVDAGGAWRQAVSIEDRRLAVR